MSNLEQEIKRRRTFAIISHPDAGKTTLTEKFLLYGGAIAQAGAVKGKKSARHAVSDWMEIEKQRGISVTSSVMQFQYEGFCINILDTPGHLEGNTVFTYLDAFCRQEHFERYLPDYADLDELKAHYTRGGLGDVKVKKFLNNVMQETLEPIRNRRKELEKDIPAVYDILKKGSDEAREVAAQTLAEVKSAMRINYFEDAELIRMQSEKYEGQ